MPNAPAIILGAMTTAFFTLLWRRLDHIDNRLIQVATRLQQIGDTVMEVKGRMDEISKHV